MSLEMTQPFAQCASWHVKDEFVLNYHALFGIVLWAVATGVWGFPGHKFVRKTCGRRRFGL